MLKLEQEPKTYDKKFTMITHGINTSIHETILSYVQPTMRVLELGCGPGTLAIQMAQKGAFVFAIDQSPSMILAAQEAVPAELRTKIVMFEGSALELPENIGTFDLIISTFMFSELRPLQQQIVLHNIWQYLNPTGKLLLADEFEPTGLNKLPFLLKRAYYQKMVSKSHLNLKTTFPLKNFTNYLEPIGFKLDRQQSWGKYGISLLIIGKMPGINNGYYRPQPPSFLGFHSSLRIARCLLTGQIDPVPIEPGIYSSGNPSPTSPIIVTANYEYTYIKVMRDLQGIDAWVLCVDSQGINVWCGARGHKFGNYELREAVRATGLTELVSHRQLILPQLAAGGVSLPEMPKSFPFTIKFGPVWSKDLKLYLKTNPIKKPESMKLALFTTDQRVIAGLTHIAFLLRKFVFWPSVISLFVLYFVNLGLATPLTTLIWERGLDFLEFFWIGLIFSNLTIALIFPVGDRYKYFLKKGILFAVIIVPFISIVTWFLFQNWIYVAISILFSIWLIIFCTMSFSGYTMASSPREIQGEYLRFQTIQWTLLIISVILYALAFFMEVSFL